MDEPYKAELTADYGAKEEKITLEEAFLATFAFLGLHHKRFGNEDGAVLGDILLEMSITSDGMPFDQALWHDWLKCVRQAQSGQVDATFRLMEPSGEGGATDGEQ